MTKNATRNFASKAAMTCVECGIAPAEVNTEAICQGYRLAFPKNSARLDRVLRELDEYSDWS